MKTAWIILSSVLLVSSTASSQISTSALLDTIQHTAFTYFWTEANPANGLIKDRSASYSPASIASIGFGLSAICIGVDHGWVPRAAARDRVLTTLQTLWQKPQGSGNGFIGYFGLYYHFLDMTTATRTWDSELSSIDTGLLLAGIVEAKQYFDGTDANEIAIRQLADSIYYRMNWDIMRNLNPGIIMAWMPGTGFLNYGPMRGYYEASIVYILAMGSPTCDVGSDAWAAWNSTYSWRTYYGYSYLHFAPLFGHQYSQCWLDLRNIADGYMRDHGITYFENSRRATLAQRAYCAANPGGFAGYSDSLWGITASDSPTGYSARGAPPNEGDDGTLVPTAPVSSIPFAPNEVMPAIRNMWNTYRSQLWTSYGFRDAFNIGKNWWDSDIIGIDQGPMIIMIENYRTGSVWKRFMKNADVQRGLQKAGFLPVTSMEEPASKPEGFRLEQNFPNPFNPSTTITFTLPRGVDATLEVYDMLGRTVATLADGRLEAGPHRVTFEPGSIGRGLASGPYWYRLRTAQASATRLLYYLR